MIVCIDEVCLGLGGSYGLINNPLGVAFNVSKNLYFLKGVIHQESERFV